MGFTGMGKAPPKLLDGRGKTATLFASEVEEKE